MALKNMFGDLALDTSVQDVKEILSAGITVNPENITTKFREAFESFIPGDRWSLSQDTNDLVQLDGNAVSASYLVISKDPLSTGGVTTIETISSYNVPTEVAVGLSMSQRVLGQELSVELVSTETPITAYSDISIASVSQSATSLTVTTTTEHSLVPGMRIGLYGIVGDSRLNYPALVVASTLSSNVFTCTAGPAGNIPSLTVGPYVNQGYVYVRSTMGGAPNGLSEIFESASTTAASVYSRSSAGDALPSGTAGGNHSLTTLTTSSTQAINSPYTYAFLPSTEYRFILQADRAQWLDISADSSAAPNSRLLRTQVVPDASKQYKLRFRFTNNKSLTVPTAKIVSATKSGATITTITTASPHGLTTGDYVLVYGIRDQTNFANLTTPQVVSSVINSTQFTVQFGVSATSTSYGGMVAKCNGANVPTGFTPVAIQNASVVSNELNLVGNVNWTWSIGDYINLYGLRDNITGADLNVDGVYKVIDVSSTAIRLAPINPQTILPIVNAACGGTSIKRTDARISFVRIFDYIRERVEIQPNGAQAASVPVVGTVSINGGSNIIPFNNNLYSLLTSTNLGASAVYTGSAINAAASTTSTVLYYTAINVSVQHTAGLAPGTLYFEVGSDTSSTAPSTWFTQFAVPIPSNANWQTFTFPLTARYYRVRFVNGNTAQTSFRLATTQIYNGAFSGELSYPNYLLYGLSTSALVASSTFTGPSLDFGDTNLIYTTLSATVYADQASSSQGFAIQVSRDGSTWYTATSATVAAASLSTITAPLVYRYARVIYTNGTVAQSTFRLDCKAGVR